MNSKLISKVTEKIKTNFIFTSTNVKTRKKIFILREIVFKQNL